MDTTPLNDIEVSVSRIRKFRDTRDFDQDNNVTLLPHKINSEPEAQCEFGNALVDIIIL